MGLNERKYENVLILTPQLNDTDVESLSQKLQEIIQGNAGEIHKVNIWGSKFLAYPIEKHSKGIYIYTEFSGPKKVLDEIDHFAKVNENILRGKTFKSNPRKILPQRNIPAAQGQ